jgi:hypothetical protein
METMLAMLGGGRPLKFGALIQSRDHRVPYMEILAWLVRHELVAQLKTVGWLQCPEERSEERGSEDRLSAGDESDDPLLSTTHSTRSASDSTSTAAAGGGQAGVKPMPVSRLLGVRRSIASASDDGSSVASDQTAFPTGVPVPLHAITSTTSIPGLELGQRRNRSRGGSVGRASVEDEQRSEDFTSQSQQGGGDAPNSVDPCFERLITDPLHPTPEQKAALRRIEASIDDVEFRERFASSLVGYFDGECAFEAIAGREGLKRARVEEWIAELEGRGFVRSFRCLV